MAMNFFKKVINFFSVIWNAISWRKNEKKGKPASQCAEEKPGIAENDPNSSVETENSFVDVPLHSSGPAACAGIPAVLTSCENESDYGLKSHSSGRQYVGLEDNTCSSLSFFSEPIRDDSKPQVPIIASSMNGSDEVGVELVETPKVGLAEATIHEEGAQPVGATKDISGEKSSPTDDLQSMHLEDPCADSYSKSSPPFVTMKNGSTDGKPQSAVIMGSFPRDHTTPITTSSNHNLDYSAIGDEKHLFDHDNITECEQFNNVHLFDHDNITESRQFEDMHLFAHDNITESGQLEGIQIIGMNKDSHSVMSPATTFESSDADPRIVESNAFTASSSITSVSADISVTPAHHLSEEKGAQESCSTYSTNYMVKSDSLVNFFPESGSDPIADEVGQHDKVFVECANARTIQEEEIDCTTPLLKEGSLEELMCTKKGILQLSGDHHIEDMDKPSDLPERSDIEKSDLNDFVPDTLLPEEPPLKTLPTTEGCNQDEPSRGDVIPDDTTTFHEIQRSNDAAHEDCETEKEMDGIRGSEQLRGKSMVIGRRSCTTVTRINHDTPDKKNKCRSDPYDGNSHDHDVAEEDQCSPKNVLSQFRTFQLGEDTSRVEHTKRPDILATDTSTPRSGGPSEKRLSSFGSQEIQTNDQFPSATKNDLANLTQRFFISSNNPSGFVESWSFSESDKASEMHVQDPESFKVIKKQESPILGIHGKLCAEVPVEESPCSQAVEDLNEFYPFIDCSSFLFRIPEEIRKETSFNPCVGSAPSRRSGFSNSLTPDSTRFGEGTDVYEKNYTNMSSLVPNSVGSVPNSSPCLPEEYKNTGLIKIQSVSGYSHQQLPEGLGTFWGTHPGMVHGDQQHNVHYPVACAENYEGEYVNVMSAAAYENESSVRLSQADSYGYISQYNSAVQFPVLGIPYGGTQQPVFLPREPLAPIIFPLHPVNLPQSEGPSVMCLEATDENEQQYPNRQTFWEGYSAHHIQLEINTEHEKETSPFGIVRGLGGPAENLSSEAIDDDDDADINTLHDPYFHMDENTSLHTVRSKADSFTGSLFCESLRSIISHNTDNENVFPSFSCSSVQGCCPSVVMQSCEATLSNDSLPSVIVEEKTYSKSVDEDYLATEKFMNDVNTALNESVMDQIQGRVEPLGNLLGRGDGSISMNPDLGDDSESIENGGLSRNSLGENISINNSKLTLLDGVLGIDSVARLPNLTQVQTCGDDSSDVTHGYCREVVDYVLERVFIPQVGQSSTNELASEANSQQTQGDDSLIQQDDEENFIVQNVVIIDGGGSQVWHVRRDGLTEELRNGDDYEITDELDVEMAVPVVSSVEHVSDTVAEDTIVETLADDEIPNRKGRRNKRRRKKSLDVDAKFDHELCSGRLMGAAGTGMSIGDGTAGRVPEKQLLHGLETNKVEAIPTSLVKSRKCEENNVSKPKADGERFSRAIEKHDSNGELVDVAQLEEQAEQLDDDEEPDQDEAGESSSNPSNNRRRRNRRKKRKN